LTHKESTDCVVEWIEIGPIEKSKDQDRGKGAVEQDQENGDLGFLAGLWGGLSVRDADFDLPQHRYDLLWLVPLDWHDQLFLQVDSLSFHLVQILPVTSTV
jgi:hypothetical protein